MKKLWNFGLNLYKKYEEGINYLFWGFDEGSMGFLDALSAGVETIVTPQGYHLDIPNGITYPCRIISDFEHVLIDIQNKRKSH